MELILPPRLHSGLFYAIGHEPATTLIKGQVQTDEDGYIVTEPGTSLTSVKGVFAAGSIPSPFLAFHFRSLNLNCSSTTPFR